MHQLDAALAVIGAVVVAIGLLSNRIKRSLLQESMLAVLAGVAVGPYGLDWLDLAEWGAENAILKEAARLTLAIALMGVALRIRREAIRVLWQPVAILLTLVMIGMWAASSVLASGMLSLSLWAAVLIGAVLTPTDPVVASAIVTGRFASEKLPLRLRQSISFESGANDGLAYAFVLLPALVIAGPQGSAWTEWLVDAILLGIFGATTVGVLFGYAAAKLLVLAERRRTIERLSLLSYTIALAGLTLGIATLLRTNALISVFVAGLVVNLLTPQPEEHEEAEMQETVAKLFTLPMFVIFGVALPIGDWLRLGWPLLLFAALVLLFRRAPIVALLSPILRRWLNRSDLAYLGWFGPIGIAAIYYAALAREHVADPLVWHAASAVIFGSIVVHGITAAPFTRVYARRRGGPPRGTAGMKERGDELD